MRIAVIGASGVAGRAFVRRAAAAGHSLRSDRVDILDRQVLRTFVEDCDAVVNVATRIGKWEMNDRIRREGTANLIAVAKNAIVVQQSSGDAALRLIPDSGFPAMAAHGFR